MSLKTHTSTRPETPQSGHKTITDAKSYMHLHNVYGNLVKTTTLYQIVQPHGVPQASCGYVQKGNNCFSKADYYTSDLGQMGLKYGAG